MRKFVQRERIYNGNMAKLTPDNGASISIIIPALHEGEGINKLLAHLRALPSEVNPELIVVDGDPEGSSIRAIKHDRIITATSPKGRANQMNHGASLATGDILLFLHADTFLPENAFGLVRACMENGAFVGGAFDLGFLTDRKIFKITEWYVACRTRLTRVPFGDQAIFIRKEYFNRISGFRELPIMEDVELMGRIKKLGHGISILPAKVMTSTRRWEKEGLVRGTLRNWMLQAMYCCGAPPERLARFYRS
jgi:rSAM/selenodomain-associated transferase 2